MSHVAFMVKRFRSCNSYIFGVLINRAFVVLPVEFIEKLYTKSTILRDVNDSNWIILLALAWRKKAKGCKNLYYLDNKGK